MARRITSQSDFSPKKILRIGIVLGGNIIEERLVRKAEPLTIGQSSKCTFCVPVEGLPKEWVLFAVDPHGYSLQLAEGMDGRISDGQSVETLEQLKAKGGLQNQGDRWILPLSDAARGKVVIGNLTVLFQFVVAPPLQPRPRLPASVRGSLSDRMDPQLAVILAISLLAHLSVAIYAHQLEVAPRSRIEQIYRDMQTEPRVIQMFDKPVVAASEAPVEQPKPDKGDKADKGNRGDKPKDSGDAPDDAAIEEKIQQSAFIKITTGGASDSGRYGEMTYTDQGADLNKSIENVRRNGGEVAALGRDGNRNTRGPNSGEMGSERGDGKVSGPDTGVNAGNKGEEEIRSMAKYDVVDVGVDTTLDPEEVARRIRSRYLDGIKRCHGRALKRNPEAQGRVNIAFTVGPSGRVTDSSVDGFDPEVDSCIQALTRGWLFGIPKDDNGKPSSASFRIPLVLKPGS
jgi:outer membrane biosynthesis protein TonB